MIYPRFVDFRAGFAEVVKETGVIFSFVDASPAYIQRSSGSFITNGYLSGHKVDTSGSANNDGRREIDVVNTTSLVLAAGETLTTEGAGATVTLRSAFIEDTGYERWPASLVRANGFDTGITSIPNPYTGLPSIQARSTDSADSVFGVDEYNWYLSQRTDVASDQNFSIVQNPDFGGNSYSGRVNIGVVQSVYDKYTAGTLSLWQLTNLFKYCYLYVQRISDDSIQWIDIHQAMTSNY